MNANDDMLREIESGERWLGEVCHEPPPPGADRIKLRVRIAAQEVWLQGQLDATTPAYLAERAKQTVRTAIGEDAFIVYPVGDVRMKRFANFGNIGLNYQHPTFGNLKFFADPMAIPNTVRFIVPDTWRELFYGWRGLKAVPGGDIAGWYRMSADTTNAGKGVILKRDWWSLSGDMCFKPWLNAQILNVAA